MLSMTETDYENWRDDLRCGGQEECDNQYTAAFTKHMPPQLKNPGIEVDYFWTLAERAGLWVCGTYGSPMSIALDNLCTVESVCDGEGHWMFNVFRLAPKEE